MDFVLALAWCALALSSVHEEPLQPDVCHQWAPPSVAGGQAGAEQAAGAGAAAGEGAAPGGTGRFGLKEEIQILQGKKKDTNNQLHWTYLWLQGGLTLPFNEDMRLYLLFCPLQQRALLWDKGSVLLQLDGEQQYLSGCCIVQHKSRSALGLGSISW